MTARSVRTAQRPQAVVWMLFSLASMIISCGLPSATASPRQKCIVDAICRAARRTSRDSKPPSTIGTMSAVPTAMTRMTTIISISVKAPLPAWSRRGCRAAAVNNSASRTWRLSPGVALPARDVATVALAARGAVGAERVEVVRPAALTRAAVVVRPIPGVLRHVLLEIRAVPPVGAERALAERRQTFLGRRIPSGIQSEGVEGGAEQLDLRARRLHLRHLGLPDEPGPDERHQETDDDHHDHHLDEREARVACPVRLHVTVPHIGRSFTLKIADSIETTMNPTPSPMTRISTGSRRRVN